MLLLSLHVGASLHASALRHPPAPRHPPPLANAKWDKSLVRLDKLLAERGAGSRKDVDRLIRAGLVELDGEVVGKAGAKLKVPWDSAPLVEGFDYPPPPLLAAYHKPLGVISSMSDDRSRPDLATVLPLAWQKLLHPVGRLDADTTGLLLFCRDGDLTHRLLHPKYLVEREYMAVVENDVDEAGLRAQLAAGVETTEGGESLVVVAELLEARGTTVRLSVTEGKYRMVRRILANCGHPVLSLHRVRYGSVVLDALGIGEGEAAPIEGGALAWALGLGPQPEAGAPPAEAGASANKGKAKPRSRQPRAPPRAPRDLEAEMAAAALREFRPRESDVTLVSEECEVPRAEAAEALRLAQGDIVEALESLGYVTRPTII